MRYSALGLAVLVTASGNSHAASYKKVAKGFGELRSSADITAYENKFPDLTNHPGKTKIVIDSQIAVVPPSLSTAPISATEDKKWPSFPDGDYGPEDPTEPDQCEVGEAGISGLFGRGSANTIIFVDRQRTTATTMIDFIAPDNSEETLKGYLTILLVAARGLNTRINKDVTKFGCKWSSRGADLVAESLALLLEELKRLIDRFIGQAFLNKIPQDKLIVSKDLRDVLTGVADGTIAWVGRFHERWGYRADAGHKALINTARDNLDRSKTRLQNTNFDVFPPVPPPPQQLQSKLQMSVIVKDGIDKRGGAEEPEDPDGPKECKVNGIGATGVLHRGSKKTAKFLTGQLEAATTIKTNLDNAIIARDLIGTLGTTSILAVDLADAMEKDYEKGRNCAWKAGSADTVALALGPLLQGVKEAVDVLISPALSQLITDDNRATVRNLGHLLSKAASKTLTWASTFSGTWGENAIDANKATILLNWDALSKAMKALDAKYPPDTTNLPNTGILVKTPNTGLEPEIHITVKDKESHESLTFMTEWGEGKDPPPGSPPGTPPDPPGIQQLTADVQGGRTAFAKANRIASESQRLSNSFAKEWLETRGRTKRYDSPKNDNIMNRLTTLLEEVNEFFTALFNPTYLDPMKNSALAITELNTAKGHLFRLIDDIHGYDGLLSRLASPYNTVTSGLHDVENGKLEEHMSILSKPPELWGPITLAMDVLAKTPDEANTFLTKFEPELTKFATETKKKLEPGTWTAEEKANYIGSEAERLTKEVGTDLRNTLKNNVKRDLVFEAGAAGKVLENLKKVIGSFNEFANALLNEESLKSIEADIDGYYALYEAKTEIIDFTGVLSAYAVTLRTICQKADVSELDAVLKVMESKIQLIKQKLPQLPMKLDPPKSFRTQGLFSVMGL